MGSSLVQTPGGRLLRRSSHEEDRPALFAAQFALSHACWLLTYLVAGVVGNEIGLFCTFGVLGLLVVVSSGLAMRLWPSADPEQLEHEHAPLAHEHLHTHDEHHQHEHEGWEGLEPHRHPHGHLPQRHRHRYVIDMHHQHWPAGVDRPAYERVPSGCPHPITPCDASGRRLRALRSLGPSVPRATQVSLR